MPDLVQRSVEILLENQSASGAYVASPNFPTYGYCWFRDGAYIAHAMDCVGEHDSARRFHDWAAGVIVERQEVVWRAIDKARRGQPLSAADILHTRYTLDGKESHEVAWPNFQLDGFGTWLWALGEHQRLAGKPLPAAWRRAARLAADYLDALWRLPCFDCWEEFPELVHTSTLAAIYGGLRSEMLLTSSERSVTLAEIKAFLGREAVLEGHFVKAPGRQDVDASLISLATPYRVVAPEDQRMRSTVALIERDLLRGGLHRYARDTYYGGGGWLLLTAWLGWYDLEAGEPGRARELLAWVESQAGEDGNMPEQVPEDLIEPPSYPVWLQRWGPVASPLLWSHAMYLILHEALVRAGALQAENG